MTSNYSRQGTQTPVLFVVVKTEKKVTQRRSDMSLTAQKLTHLQLIGLPSGHNASQFHKDGVKFKTASAY